MAEKVKLSEAHTPGPWATSNGRLVRVMKHGTGVCICGVHRIGRFVGEGEARTPEVFANARLIAAAPDLLEAAKKVLAGLNARIDAAPITAVPVFNGITDLQHAIAKAEGRAE